MPSRAISPAFKAFRENLPPAQRAVLLVLLTRRGVDVPVIALYRRLSDEKAEPRYMQQRVGAILSKLNKGLADFGLMVKPGIGRRTYRLYRTDAG
jgi:hypothetical protein